MAFSGTVTHAYHGTLAGGTADKVNFTTGFYTFGVINRGTVDIYLRPNTVGTAVPTVKADNTYCVPQQPSGVIPKRHIFQLKDQVTYVQLVGAVGSCEYSVEGYR